MSIILDCFTSKTNLEYNLEYISNTINIYNLPLEMSGILCVMVTPSLLHTLTTRTTVKLKRNNNPVGYYSEKLSVRIADKKYTIFKLKSQTFRDSCALCLMFI